MCCDMICQSLALVGFVFTVGAVELEDASVSIFTILHLVKAHVSMSTLITPAVKLHLRGCHHYTNRLPPLIFNLS